MAASWPAGEWDVRQERHAVVESVEAGDAVVGRF